VVYFKKLKKTNLDLVVMCSSRSSQWPARIQEVGHRTEVAIEVEEVVAERRSRRGGHRREVPTRFEKVVTRGSSPAWGGTCRMEVTGLRRRRRRTKRGGGGKRRRSEREEGGNKRERW
jgi:hypothetical protein